MALMKLTRGALSVGAEGTSAYAPLFTQGQLTVANLISELSDPGYESTGRVYVGKYAQNLIPNGNAASGIAGWTPGGTCGLESSGEWAQYGDTSFKLTHDGSTTNIVSTPITFPAAGTYSIGLMLYVPEGSTWNASVFAQRNNYTGSSTILTTPVWPVPGPPIFTSRVFTVDAGDLVGTISLECVAPPAGAVLHFGMVMLNAGYVPLEYVDTDGAIAERARAQMLIPNTPTICDETKMWAIFRFMARRWSASNEPGGGASYPRIWQWPDGGSGKRLAAYYAENVNKFGFDRYDDDGVTAQSVLTSAVTLADGDKKTLAVACDATYVYAMLGGDGAWATGGGGGYIPDLSAELSASFGYTGTGSYINTPFYWAAFGVGEKPPASFVDSLGDPVPLPYMFPKSSRLTAILPMKGDGTGYRYGLGV